MRLGQQVVSVLATRAFVIGIAFLTGLVVARNVGPEGKGVLTVLASLVTLVSVVAGLGLATGGVHLYKAAHHSIGTIIGVSLVVWAAALAVLSGLAAALGDAVLAVFLTGGTSIPVKSAWLWLSLATLPPLLLSGLIQSIWLADGRMRVYAAISVGGQLVGLAATWLLVSRLEQGVTGALTATLAAQSTMFVASLAWLHSLGERGRLRSPVVAIRQVLRAGHGGYLNSIVANAFKHGEALLLAVLLTLDSVGHYGVALAFYQLLTEAPRAAVWPLVGRMTGGDAQAAEVAARGLRVMPVALVLPVLAMAAVSPYVVPLVYGSPFAPAGILLAFMTPGVVFRSVHLVVYSYLAAVGRLEKIAFAVGLAAASNLALDVILVPSWGLGGVAFSNVVSELVLAALSLVVFVRESRVPWRRVFVGRTDLQDLFRNAGQMVTPWRS